ncbi:MAG TPA: PKD domain-containing protein [Dehalococcoidia bacterium]
MARYKSTRLLGLALVFAMIASGVRPSRAQERTILLDVAGPLQAVAGQPVTFATIVPSLPGTPPALGYIWGLSDGWTDTGAVLTHAFAAPGSYTVAVTAYDVLHPEVSATVQQTVTVGTSAAEDAAAPEDAVALQDGEAEEHGWALAQTDADGTLHVRIALHGARPSVYGMSVCLATTPDDVTCVPTGTALGLRFCQTQDPNTGVSYCMHTDQSGEISNGSFERPYPNLPFVPNLVLVWNLDDGTDWYRASIGPGVPDTLHFPDAMPPAGDDD